jgi:hypothetical protein
VKVCIDFFSISKFFLNYFIFLLDTTDELELTWLRNNKEIPDNPDFRRERTGYAFKLIVAEV